MPDARAIGRALHELVADSLGRSEPLPDSKVDEARLFTELLLMRVYVAEAAVKARLAEEVSKSALQAFHIALDRSFAGRIAGGEDALFSALVHDRLDCYARAVGGHCEVALLGRELARLCDRPDDTALINRGEAEATAFGRRVEQTLADASAPRASPARSSRTDITGTG